MGALHKRNGGYIGADYRKPYPSGVHVVGGVGRVTELTVDVELYGGVGGQFNAFGFNGTPGNGGYTKFRVKLDTANTLQVRPLYMPGGSGGAWAGAGGAGSGLLVNNQWLGVAGGGGGCGGRYEYTWSGTSTVYPTTGGNGSGGYGSGGPSTGGTAVSCGPYSDTGTSPYNYLGASASGHGGGGASGGSATAGGCYGSWNNPGPTAGGNGGSGNLRVYYDQSTTSGYLGAVAGVYMEYLTHSNGSHSGPPQVKITDVATSASYTYTGSKDIKAVYIATGEFNP